MTLPPLSYSFLSDYQNCPAKALHKYVLKDIAKESSPALEHGIRVHKALEDRIRFNQPLPADMPYEPIVGRIQAPPGGKVKAEWQLGIATSGKWVGFFSDPWLRGKLDVTIVNEAHDTAMLLDWKTGKVREDPFELEVQALLLKGNVPDLKVIRGAYVWLKGEPAMGKVHDVSDTARTRTRVDALHADMVAGKWHEEPNPLCGWCSHKACKHNRSE